MGKLRTAQFELRAKNLGIVGEKLAAQKVAIWEGMWAAQQIGDDVGVSILCSALSFWRTVVGLLLIEMGIFYSTTLGFC